MTMKTKVVNTTSKVFILKEGTAGVYRLLKKLEPEEMYMINVDPNATYREYFCAVRDDDPEALILSSDDCQEYDVVRIREKPEAGSSQPPSYFWDKESRGGKRKALDALEKALPCSNSEEPSDNSESFLGKALKKLTPGFLKRDTLRTVKLLEEIVVKR